MHYRLVFPLLILCIVLIACGDEGSAADMDQEALDWIGANGVTLPPRVGGLDGYPVDAGLVPQFATNAETQVSGDTVATVADQVVVSVTLPPSLQNVRNPSQTPSASYSLGALIVSGTSAGWTDLSTSGAAFVASLEFPEGTSFVCIIVQRGTEDFEPVIRSVFFKVIRSAAPLPGPGSPGLEFELINGDTEYGVRRGTATAVNIVIPASHEGKPVTAILEDGFEEYTAMRSVTMPNSIRTIRTTAFLRCYGLEHVAIPSGVRLIDEEAFAYCTNLAFLTIANGVTNIERYAFADCPRLASVNLPNSLQLLGDYAFLNNTNLASVSVGTGLISLGDEAFRNCRKLTTVTLPHSLAILGDSAFWDCTSLVGVSIGSGITLIKTLAFTGCSLLEYFYVHATTPPTLGANVFNQCAKLGYIYVPAASQAAYKAASGWSAYPFIYAM